MFGSLGFTEIAFILVLALLLFGPKRLPEIGRTIGKGLGEFRRASNDLRRTLENEVALDEAAERRRPELHGPPRPLPVPKAEATADGAGAPAPNGEPAGASEPTAVSDAAASSTGARPASRSVERAD